MRISPSFFALSIAIFATDAYAGAWTQPESQTLVITNFSYSNSTRYFNNQGRSTSEPSFRKFEVNPYIEYGLLDGLTVGGSLSLQAAYQNVTGGGTLLHYGIGDSELFLRKRLWEQDGFTLSAEPMVKLPSFESRRLQPQLGSKHPDAGLGFSAGYGFDAWGQHHFTNVDTQYRYRFGAPKDQIRLSGTLGLAIDDRWMAMPQFFLTRRTATPAFAAFTQSPGDDYDLTRLQLSAIYTIDPDLRVQLGGFGDIDGKNAGAGKGVIFSIWHTL